MNYKKSCKAICLIDWMIEWSEDKCAEILTGSWVKGGGGGGSNSCWETQSLPMTVSLVQWSRSWGDQVREWTSVLLISPSLLISLHLATKTENNRYKASIPLDRKTKQTKRTPKKTTQQGRITCTAAVAKRKKRAGSPCLLITTTENLASRTPCCSTWLLLSTETQ